MIFAYLVIFFMHQNFLEIVGASYCLTTTTPFIISSVPLSTYFFTTFFQKTTTINRKPFNYVPTVVTTTFPRYSLHFCIYGNTIGLYKSGQTHPNDVYSSNNAYECGLNCASVYPECNMFIFSNKLKLCYTFNKIKWSKLSLIHDNNFSIGRVTNNLCINSTGFYDAIVPTPTYTINPARTTTIGPFTN